MKKILVGLLGLAYFFFIGGYFFLGAGRDDCFITFWSASQLAVGKGLVNYNYFPCEVSSSLLHVLLLAVFHKLTSFDLFVVAKYLGIAASLAVLFVGLSASKNIWHAVIFSILLLGNQSFMYWSFGGLETPIAALILFCYCVALSHAFRSGRWPWAGFFGGLAILGRPEGFIVILIAFSSYLFFHMFQESRKPNGLGSHVSILAFIFLLLTSARLYVFDSAFPNPVYAKTEISAQTILEGLNYLLNWAKRPWNVTGMLAFGVLIPNFIIGARDKRLDPVLPIFTLAVLGYMAFIIMAGGDWMEYGRFCTHFGPCLAFASALALTRITSRWIGAIMVVGLIGLFGSLAFVQFEPGNCSEENPRFLTLTRAEDLMMLNCAHKRDLTSLLPYLSQKCEADLSQFPANLVIYSYQAGFFPYMLRKIHSSKGFIFLDASGITEPILAKLDVPKASTGIIAQYDYPGTLEGLYGEYSHYVSETRPHLIYGLEGDQNHIKRLQRLGYELSWNRNGAIILLRK